MSRNLDALLKKWKKAICVEVSMITLTLKARWPRIKPEQTPYPFVSLSAWASFILGNEPRYFLGGCDDLTNTAAYCQDFSTFWQCYRVSDPGHPVYSDFIAAERAFVIPYAIHGDEGRGTNFIPTLVVAYQMIITPRGMDFTNTAGFLS